MLYIIKDGEDVADCAWPSHFPSRIRVFCVKSTRLNLQINFIYSGPISGLILYNQGEFVRQFHIFHSGVGKRMWRSANVTKFL